MSKVRELLIRSESDALMVVEQAFEGKLADDDAFLIRFEGWPVFNLDVEGPRYHSTVTTPLMKSLIDYQQVIHRIFSESVYSKGARALTEEDRAALELTFEVAEGSSDIQSVLSEAFNKFGEQMINKMTGRQLVLTVLGLALVAACYFGHQTQTTSQLALTTENNRSALETRLLDSNDKLSKALADTNQALVGIVRATPDATRVTIGKTVFEREDIVHLNQKERETTVPARVDGDYQILSVRSLDDRWRMDIAKPGAEDNIKVDLFKGQHAAGGINELMDALVSGQSAYLYLLARIKDNRIVSATLLGTKTTGLAPTQ